jgi:hypothetical protein
MLTGLIVSYLLLIIICIATNFNFFSDFVNHDLKDEVKILIKENNILGNILETLSILLFMLLYPIMMSVIIFKGGLNKC